MYIFPGVGLGALVEESSEVSEKMFLIAATTLAAMVTRADLSLGRIYPSLSRIREVSMEIAVEVAREAVRAGLAGNDVVRDEIRRAVEESVFHPVYQNYV